MSDVRFAADESAVKVLTVWISVSGVATTAFIATLAGLFTPWLLLGSVLIGIATVFGALWYPPRFAASLHGSFDGTAVRAVTGVINHKELFVPMGALRTFELCSTPIQQLYGCRTIILRFAGGAAVLPLLPVKQAEALTAALENSEK